MPSGKGVSDLVLLAARRGPRISAPIAPTTGGRALRERHLTEADTRVPSDVE